MADTISLDPKTANLLSAISYIIPLIGLILVIIIKKGENQFARFHSLQSLGLWVAFLIVSLVLGITAGIIAIIPILGWIIAALIAMLSGVLYLIAIVVAIFCLYKTIKNEKYYLPFIGKFVESYA